MHAHIYADEHSLVHMHAACKDAQPRQRKNDFNR